MPSPARPSQPPTAPLLLAALAVLAMAPACASTDPGERLTTLYERSRSDAEKGSPPPKRVVEARAGEARRLAEAGALTRPQELLLAASLLYESRTLENVALARELALHAVELGDARGLPIAAEAEDVELMIRGLPQRYGTQYVYDAATEHWSLYPVDPRTSDTERAAMGIVSLEEARLREAILNERQPVLPRPGDPR